MASAKAHLPKYLRISGEIVDMIRRGELTAGSRAPSENDIIQRYRVSNTTARKALAEIEQSGWVTRIKGRGTFVQRRSVGRSADRILSFTRNMVEAGRVPSTRLLGVRLLDTSQSLVIHGRRYRLDGPVCRIERLRLADNVPMMKEIRYVSAALCPGIEQKALEGSLYQIYEKDYGLELVQIDQKLSVVMIEAEREMGLFELTKPVPAFRVEGATFVGKGAILEMEESLYRGDLYSFSVQARR
ncbi:MAG TPA: GntR family transcriptional regulator [Acidobacteriota bacterium]|nr:GntR family transcriptional regulator [Acidobacteriota bacterium]